MELTAGTPKAGRLPWARFVVLAIFSLANASNAFLWICFSPIFQYATERFQVSNTAVNMLSLVFLFAYLPASIMTVYVVERYGLRTGLVMGTAMNAVCCWIRYVATFVPAAGGGSYALLLVGQVIGAIAQPFFTNLPARVSAEWFPASQRDGATVVASMSNPVGNALGSVIPALVVAAAGDIPSLLLGQAVACTVLALISYVGIPAKPPSPPSASAAHRQAERQRMEALHHSASGHATTEQASATPTRKTSAAAAGEALLNDAPVDTPQPLYGSGNGGVAVIQHGEDVSGSGGHATTAAGGAHAALHAMKEDLVTLLRNRNFLCLATGFGVGLGVFNALLTLLAQLLQPCGYGDQTAGNAGAALLGAGLLGAGIAGVVLEKTRLYVPVLRLGIVAALACTVFMLGSLRRDAEDALTASFALLGFFLIPLLPVALENAAECTYPIPEDTSSALLMTIGQVVGIILIFALGPLLATPASAACETVVTPSAGFVLGWMVLAAAVIAAYRKDYRRQAAEAEESAASVGAP